MPVILLQIHVYVGNHAPTMVSYTTNGEVEIENPVIFSVMAFAS
jgi:hypothetical protein